MNPQDLVALGAVAAACCIFAALVLIVEVHEKREAQFGVLVEIKRQGRDFRAHMSERDGGRRRVTEHGVVWLDQKNIVKAGDSLFSSRSATIESMSILLSSEQIEGPNRLESDAARYIVLAEDRGGAFFVEWAGDASVRSGGLVVLWTLDRRRRAAPPVVLRGDQAAGWITYLKEPGSEPPQAPPIRLALIGAIRRIGFDLLHKSAAKSGSQASSRSATEPTGVTRVWVLGILGSLTVLIAGLVALDLLDIRQYVRLSSHYDWLAFIGAIVGGVVGGLVTFGGVLLTLRNAQAAERSRQSAEDLRNRLSMLPLFEFRVSYDPKHFDNSVGQLAEEPGTPVFSLDRARWSDPGVLHFGHALIVGNVGLGHAMLRAVEYVVRDAKGEMLSEEKNGFMNFLIKNGSVRVIRAYFVAPRDNPRFEDPRQNAYQVVVTLRYEDLLANTYHQVVHTTLFKGLSAGEDPRTGGKPVTSLNYAEPPVHDQSAAP